jgi:hypothetical protein
MMPTTSFNTHVRTSSQCDEQQQHHHHQKSNNRTFSFHLSEYSILLDSFLGRQISFDANLLTTNDTFAFDNSLCGSNDDLQSTKSPAPPPPIPPRVPRTSNGSNKNSSPS